MQLEYLRDLDLSLPSSSGHKHLSAGSGLAVAGNFFYVVGDDELNLARFSSRDNKPGELTRLFPGSLPRDARQRKSLKPDLELLTLLPPGSDWPHGTLLAMGSGSTERRMRGALVTLDRLGGVRKVMTLDLSPLFEAIRSVIDAPNIEAAALLENRLLLFNRGNTSNPETTVLSVDPEFIYGRAPASVHLRKRLNIGTVEGVPLSVTDACSLGDDAVLVSVVAEDTSNAYDDGRLVGAAFAILDPNLDIRHIEAVGPTVKIEGVHAWRTEGEIRVLAVTDADDPIVASKMFSGSISTPGGLYPASGG